MAKKDKLLERMRNNPRAVTFDDLDKLLRQLGFVCRQPRSGSSHFYYTYKTLTLSVPYKRPHLKEAYVKQALLYIDSVLSQEGEG